jgi:hypothetical protein
MTGLKDFLRETTSFPRSWGREALFFVQSPESWKFIPAILSSAADDG